jgi:hypothetical protein
VRPFPETLLLEDSHIQVWLDILSSDYSFDEPLSKKWTIEEISTNEFNPNYKQ